MKSSFSKGLLLALGLTAALVASAVEPAELDAMRGKALRGNVLAQYNLGRYHSDPSAGVLDRAEAFAWLKLAAENGTGSLELVKLTEEMSPAELAEGRRRFEERRQQLKSGTEPVAAAAETTAAADAQAKLQAERDQLAASLGAATTELAQLRAAQAQNAGAEKLRSEVIKLESELNETRAAARQMAVRNQQLEDAASERGRALAAAKTELEQAKAAAGKPAEVTDTTALAAEKESLQKQLTAAQEELRKAKADGERVERAERDVLVLRAQNEKLSAEQARAQEAVANVTQLTREVERLRSAQAQSPSADELILARERLAAMERQNAELVERARQAETRLVAAASTPAAEVPAGENVAELKSKLADTEMKLATALRSYTLQQQEFDKSREQTARAQADVEARLNTATSDNTALNTQLQNALAELKAREAQLVDIDKAAGVAKQTSLTATIEATALRDQLRQTQSQLVSVIEENSQLKTKLAVIAPPPSSSLGAPIRPGTAAAQAAITLPPAIAPSGQSNLSAPSRTAPATRPAAAAVAVTVPVPEVRTHIVAEGDSLSKISRKYYGTSERWNEIYEANRNILNNPSRLPAGASLRIP
jgi:nucleoid-associated protein YgaU